MLREFSAHADGITALAAAPASDVLATGAGYSDASVELWDSDTGDLIRELKGHQAWIYGLTFSPDARTLATAGQEGMAKLWNLTTQREIVTLKGHLRSLHALDISPDGRRLVTGSGGAESVKLWDIQTHQELITLAGDGSLTRAIAFPPDGNRIMGLISDSNNQLHLHILAGALMEQITTADARVKREWQTP